MAYTAAYARSKLRLMKLPPIPIDLDLLRPGWSLARVRGALEGTFEANALDDDERELFDDLLAAAMDGTHTQHARDFWASFAGQLNTDS